MPKKRASPDQARLSELDRGLQGMFRQLQGRALPDRLRSVVEQLDDGAEAVPPRRVAEG